MPITEPNLVMSLNPRNCHFTIFLCSFIPSVIHNWKCRCLYPMF